MLALIPLLLACSLPARADADPPLTFERTVIDLGPVPDDQPIKQPFKFVYTGARAGKLEFQHCHFCPTPESDRPIYQPGQQGFVILELDTQGKYGDAHVNGFVAVDGIPDSTTELTLKASVRPRIMVRPDFLKLPDLPRDIGGQATMTVVSRRRDLQVLSVKTESPWVDASAGEPHDLDDLGDNCVAVPINIRLKPGLPLGEFTAVVQAQTNDPIRPLIGCSIEAQVVGDLACFPAAAAPGPLRPGQPYSIGFTLSSRTGRGLFYGSVRLDARPGRGMPPFALDVAPGEDIGTLRVTISGKASSSPIARLDGEVVVSTEDTQGHILDELRVPVRLSVRSPRTAR